MTFGFLVRSTDNDLGIGKLVAVEEPLATVEYFASLGQRISKTVPRASISRVRLQRQTRCYLYREETETWQIGRIYEWDEENEEYQVDLPNSRTVYASEAEIYVRCNQPIEDPIDILAMKGQETPYFHNKRSQFLKTVIQQRAASQGMTGLLSANIQLFPHQVEVIRRVLEDPIQRYLLADEVGLGKTIEAGAILRQFLLDEPLEKALILVPPSLYYQWQQELEDKFYVSCFEDGSTTVGERSRTNQRVKLVSTEDRKKLTHLGDNYHFLIIDEAHHLASMAFSEDFEKRRYFETCRKLAHKAEKLLLLSATPVLNPGSTTLTNPEKDFLAMLHLLDPDTYQLEDLDGFKERVEKSQEIGRVLLGFKEGMQLFPLKGKIKQLQDLFKQDNTLLSLIEELETGSKTEDEEGKNQQIRAIRTHIGDTYRLHRRMLRNRRATVEDVIFERQAVPKLEYDLDERVYSLHELLDEWRLVAPDEVNYQRIFILLFRASNTWLGILKQVLEVRLYKSSRPALIEDIGRSHYDLLNETPLFPEESNILTSILQLLNSPSEDGDRLELLKMILLYDLADRLKLQSFKSNLTKLQQNVKPRIERPFANDKFPKLVIFSSFSQTGMTLVNYLGEIVGKNAIVSHQKGENKETLEANLKRFRNHPQCFILVADSSGEEGINLQWVDGVIHFDLPLSPNQLEQRLGRVDRIGSKLNINYWLLAGSDCEGSFSEAWYKLLSEGFNIFTQSIASLQSYVESKLPEIERILFKSGGKKLEENIPQIRAEIEQEIVNISEQYALDTLDYNSQVARNYFEQLKTYDDQHKLIEKSVEGWLCKSLAFHAKYDNNVYSVRSYKATTKTLVSPKDLKKYFASAVGGKGVYDRHLANQSSGVHLYRIGQELIDALIQYLNWDDRGKAFAMWRWLVSEVEPQCFTWDEGEGGEWLGFRFDYIVEMDWEKIDAVLEEFSPSQFNQKALKRQGDALFPPRVETVFLDRNFERVEDEILLTLLQGNYSRKGEEYKDYNLAKDRLFILDEFVESSQWKNFCYEARNRSESLLRESTYWQETCKNQRELAEIKLMNRLSQLESRYQLFPQPKLAEELKIETALTEAFLSGISHPRCYLDAVGFLIVSGHSPADSVTKIDESL